MADFTHLHVHTEYSLLDGVNRIPKLMEKVKDSGMTSVAMTDHGVMHGLAEFWLTAKDFGVKPIIGCEIYVSPGRRDERKEIDGIKYYHLLLLAQNKVGFHNLVKLISIAQLEGMYYRPRVDRETLQKYSEGIICTSACLAGPLSRHLLSRQDEKALDWLKFLKGTYPDHFYLELQRNGFEQSGADKLTADIKAQFDTETIRMLEEQIYVNERLRDWGSKHDLPLVGTTDAHYLNASDKDVQKILFCVKDGIQLGDTRAREGYAGTYIKTPQEMAVAFADDKTPLENTMRIAESIEEYDITFDRVQPQYWDMQPGKSAREELLEQTLAGAEEKYGQVTKELRERIDYELEVIHDKGYDDYFLVVSDIMKWAAKNGILTGVRGSVAGSVVAHCMDIVEVDPIGWELYFERFLNPERPSPPDIDLDIQDSRRDELIQYVKETYGEKSVAAIAAIGRFKTKAAIRDVARVMGVDLQTADKLSKMVTVLFGKVFTIDKQMETDPEFKRIIESDPQLIKLTEYVRQIEGMARHMSVHACGYLVTPDDIVNYTPLQFETGGGDRVITQLEGPWIEEMGLMKFDFLGLRTLTIISNAIKNIQETTGELIDFYKIPPDDTKTFELFSRGETMGVFQFESPPMRKYLQDLKPETQEDLCFMVAAYRPGPMKYIPDYIARKQGKQDTVFLIPEMKPILENTYGFAIYQEQVIRIAVDVAGYSMGQADLLRRAMGKKKIKIMKKEEPIFKKGIKERGYDQDIADKVWEYLLPFADYGFNKAHAAGYAVLAYKCAYLKAHYPLQFMAALMYSDLGDSDRIVIDIDEAQRMGYEVVPPDINKSNVHFTAEGDNLIRFGLGAIKNVGTKVCEDIVSARRKHGEFKNLDDFIGKVTTKKLNRKAIECLIMAGALDQFGPRSQLLAVMPGIVQRIIKEGSIAEMGQTDMFGNSLSGDIELSASPLPDVEPESKAQKIAWEKELMGIFLSSHPLDDHYWIALKKGYTTIAAAKKLKPDTSIKIPAIIANTRQINTKKDGKQMAFVSLEDLTDSADSVIFPRDYEVLKDRLEEAVPLIFSGKTNLRDDQFSIIINKVEPMKVLRKPRSVIINITKVLDEEELKLIRECVDKEGDIELEIWYGNQFNPSKIKRRLKNGKECVRRIGRYVVHQ